jgi:hypothetical protein
MSIYLGEQSLPGRIYLGSERLGSIYDGLGLLYQTNGFTPIATEALIYHNLSNANSFSPGDSVIFDLSGNGNNGSITKVLGTGTSVSTDGNIVRLKNTITDATPSGNASVINLASGVIQGADFSTSGITMNFWVKPEYGVVFGAFNDPLPQELFTVGEGGRTPFTFSFTAKNGGDAIISLRVGNKNDTNEDSVSISYTTGVASTFISTYRLLSFVWDCGSSYRIYYDGTSVASSSTVKTWSGSSSLTFTNFGMGGSGANEFLNSYYTLAGAWAETWADSQVLDFFNTTKAFYGR